MTESWQEIQAVSNTTTDVACSSSGPERAGPGPHFVGGNLLGCQTAAQQFPEWGATTHTSTSAKCHQQGRQFTAEQVQGAENLINNYST